MTQVIVLEQDEIINDVFRRAGDVVIVSDRASVVARRVVEKNIAERNRKQIERKKEAIKRREKAKRERPDRPEPPGRPKGVGNKGRNQ